MKTIKVTLPDQVYRQLDTLVKDGWFKSQEDVVEEALRRYLSSQSSKAMEESLREEVDSILGVSK